MHLTRDQIETITRKKGNLEASKIFHQFFNSYRTSLNSFDVKELYDAEYFKKLDTYIPTKVVSNLFPLHYNYATFQYIINTIKQGKILDLGCGNGDFTLALASKGFECTGVDFDEQSIKQAQLKSLNHSIKVNFMCTDVVDLPDTINFDCIVMNDVTEHLSDTELIKVLNKVKQMLTPKGFLLIHTPNGLALCNQTDNSFLQKLYMTYLSLLKNYKGFERTAEQMYYDQVHINVKSFRQLNSLLSMLNFSSKVIYDPEAPVFNKLNNTRLKSRGFRSTR